MIQEHLKLSSLPWGKVRGRLGEEMFWVGWGGVEWWATMVSVWL